jgi:hypothetical protein
MAFMHELRTFFAWHFRELMWARGSPCPPGSPAQKVIFHVVVVVVVVVIVIVVVVEDITEFSCLKQC